MKKVKMFFPLFAFVLAISSAVALMANSSLLVTRDSDKLNCPSGTLNQATTNCSTTDHSKGRCTVTIAGSVFNAFNSSDGSCSDPLFIIN